MTFNNKKNMKLDSSQDHDYTQLKSKDVPEMWIKPRVFDLVTIPSTFKLRNLFQLLSKSLQYLYNMVVLNVHNKSKNNVFSTRRIPQVRTYSLLKAVHALS